MKLRPTGFLAILFIFQLVSFIPISSAAPPDQIPPSKITARITNGNPVDASSEAALEEIRQHAVAKGWARIIIELRTETELAPEQIASSPILESIQLKEVRAAQDAYLEAVRFYLIEETAYDVQRMQLLPFVTLRLTAAAVASVANHPLVKSISTEGTGKPLLQDSIPQIGADSAHNSGATGSGWAVAVIDTGARYTHSFLFGSLVSEACYSTPDPRASTLCYNGLASGSTSSGAGRECNNAAYGCGHGTHVAGIAVGNGNMRDGVALSAELISIQALSEKDTCPLQPTPCLGEEFKETDVADALQRVYQLRNSHNIAVVNMSLGLSLNSGDYSNSDCGGDWPMVDQYVNLLTASHIAVVAASGNVGDNTNFGNRLAPPACIDNVISVASVAKDDTFAPYSNAANSLDILAPGGVQEDTSTTIVDPITSSSVNGGFENLHGTSAASPHLAGAIAAFRSIYPYPTVSAIQQQFIDTGLSVTFTQTSIAHGTQNYTIPLIRLDDALTGPTAPSQSPSSLAVNGGSCYGHNDLNWSSVSDPNVTEYQVEGSPYSNYSSGKRWYAGQNTSTFINVLQTTYFRVRACNLISCGPWKNASSPATVYPGCA